MRPNHRFNLICWFAIVCLGLMSAATDAHAGDLPAAGDGEHLWLIQQAEPAADEQDTEPRLTLYHLPAETDSYFASKIEPIKGELMPRGIAAGDGRLLIVTDDRKLTTIRPVWSDLLRSWEYQQRSLTALPEGCTLVALAMGDRGPWALVQVQSRELLEQLGKKEPKDQVLTDEQMLNKALGLPEDLRWEDGEPTESEPEETPEQPDESEAEEEEEDVAEPIEPELPAYRLIHLRSSKWTSTPLPQDFDMPREAVLLIRPGDDRPTLLIDSNASSSRLPVLVRYNPVASAEVTDEEAGDQQDPAWVRLVTGMQLIPGRQWSASLVNGQIVIALERYRSQTVITIDTFLLRGDDTYEIGYTNVSVGDNARWALCPRQNQVGLLASPAPPPDPSAKQTRPMLALLVGMSLDGQPMFQNDQGQTLMMPISEKKPTLLEGNADLFVQIMAFITAMFMMVMFYRRAPQQEQLDLPDHLVLASFSRRAIAGMIDLAPGFFLAGLIYGVSVGEIVLESWPGNGIDKAFAAMRPGFVVILVTLFHTTICEFILARSLGKILMGMYVADLNGKPAPPMPCFGRALSRAFELFAPLMILVAVISPARQRLGDILAKTTVVMRKPEPPPEPEDNDDY